MDQSEVDRLKTLYKDKKNLEDELIATLAKVYPVGSKVEFSHHGHPQIGNVVDHSRAHPEIWVENINTGKCRWLTLWHLFDENKQ